MEKKTVIRLMCLLVIVALLSVSCATTDVVFSSKGGTRTGTINVLLSRPAQNLSVLVDGKILVDARWVATRRVNVLNVPAGQHEVKIFANSWALSEQINQTDTVSIDKGDAQIIIQVRYFQK